MTLKDKILIDLAGIKSPSVLNQIFDFIQLVKQGYSVSDESNKSEVLQFTGKISDESANEINAIIDSEFNSIG